MPMILGIPAPIPTPLVDDVIKDFFPFIIGIHGDRFEEVLGATIVVDHDL